MKDQYMEDLVNDVINEPELTKEEKIDMLNGWLVVTEGIMEDKILDKCTFEVLLEGIRLIREGINTLEKE